MFYTAKKHLPSRIILGNDCIGMLVTIGVKCFNQEKYIGAAVRAALRQTHRPLEVVVCDDASTDGSWAEIGGAQRTMAYELQKIAAAGLTLFRIFCSEILLNRCFFGV